MVEQRETRHQGVHVGGHARAEDGQVRVAVAAPEVAEELVVGAVLAHHEEDVLDGAAGAQRRPGGGLLRVRGWTWRVAAGESCLTLASDGSCISPAWPRTIAGRYVVPDSEGRRRLWSERWIEGPEDGVGGVGRHGPGRVRADADAPGGDVEELRRATAAGPESSPRPGGRPPSGSGPPASRSARAWSAARQPDDGDLVGARLGGEQAGPVGPRATATGIVPRPGAPPTESVRSTRHSRRSMTATWSRAERAT